MVSQKLAAEKSKSPHVSGAMQRRSQTSTALTRVRISSQSPIVWSLWINVYTALTTLSTVIQQMQSSQYPDEHASRFLNQYAATTLVRYLTTILQFLRLCADMHVQLAELSDATLSDLLVCGALARRSDGSGPKSSVTVKALRWAHKQLGISVFSCAFGALVASFDKQKLPADRRASLPFPLFVLMKWERRILQAQASVKEIVVLGAFLMLCWTGLRFSDVQRSTLATWQLDHTSLRGLTWRAKTCSTCTPFGMALAGFLSKGDYTWVHKYLRTLESIYKGQDAKDIDYALPAFHNKEVQPFDAMSYTEALFNLRQFMLLPWSAASPTLHGETSSYSIHGLKATLLAWAAQADLSENDRRMHGKHKPAQMSVQLYSRDDIEGSLRLQLVLIAKITDGWRPVTPLSRGGQTPLREPQFVLEKFRKELPSFEWTFFQFHTQSQLQQMADILSAQDPTQEVSDEESSSSSSTSSESQSDEISPVRPARVYKKLSVPPMDAAEEALMGLHRNTWHIMIRTDASRPNLPEWEGSNSKRHVVVF